MRLFFAALALMSSAALAAPPCTVPGLPNIKGKSYHLARGMMIEAGFKPVMRTQTDDITTREIVSLGYNEVEGCTGSGVAACRFGWTSDKKPFAVITNNNKTRRLLCL